MDRRSGYPRARASRRPSVEGDTVHLALPHTIPASKDPRIRLGFLPNGSALDGSPSQVLEPQQHGEHSFELAVEMDLVASKPLQLVRIERLAERLLADQRPVGQFLLAGSRTTAAPRLRGSGAGPRHRRWLALRLLRVRLDRGPSVSAHQACVSSRNAASAAS